MVHEPLVSKFNGPWIIWTIVYNLIVHGPFILILRFSGTNNHCFSKYHKNFDGPGPLILWFKTVIFHAVEVQIKPQLPMDHAAVERENIYAFLHEVNGFPVYYFPPGCFQELLTRKKLFIIFKSFRNSMFLTKSLLDYSYDLFR